MLRHLPRDPAELCLPHQLRPQRVALSHYRKETQARMPVPPGEGGGHNMGGTPMPLGNTGGRPVPLRTVADRGSRFTQRSTGGPPVPP